MKEYLGGDGSGLTVKTSGGQARFRLPRGHATLYPATTIHSVAAVTKGARDAAVTWFRSVVGAAERRELLHDLDTASRIVRKKTPNSDEARPLLKCYANPKHMWVEV